MPQLDPLPALVDATAPVVYFPVRHHSPRAARLVRALIRARRPVAVLVEGPSDFNDKLQELYLPHRLPIAIYSYLRRADGERRGAFYPFCEHSPEWQALLAAREIGAVARFIDLPWAALAGDSEQASHRYADGRLRRSPYIERLGRELGVQGLDALWDTLFEVDDALTPESYLERAHHFCHHARQLDVEALPSDLRREAFMAARVAEVVTELGPKGPLLVVSGGFHSAEIWRRVRTNDFVVDGEPSPDGGAAERGIALTPYTYELLDGLAGYEAGMPSPGFYHRAWLDAEQQAQDDTVEKLLHSVACALRARGQPASSADLIAALGMARGLAALRGRSRPWRLDLVDGVLGALVKEELEEGRPHPFMEAVQQVLRGQQRGLLAAGTSLPPLVVDVQQQLDALDLAPAAKPRELALDLGESTADLERSRVLHRLRVIDAAGFELFQSTDLIERGDLSSVGERWRVVWSPDLEASCIAAAIYGPTLAAAAAARLGARAARVERDAEAAALLLLDGALIGVPSLAKPFYDELARVIHRDGDFFSVAGALDHLLFLYRYDAVLGAAGLAPIGTLLALTFERTLWLLEGLGRPVGKDAGLLRAVRRLLETFERCAVALGLDREACVAVLRRVAAEDRQLPLTRGAALGALWSLGAAEANPVLAAMRAFADPALLGDFLGGLFGLAREVAQRHPELVAAIDEVLLAYADDEFLLALPALRLAFTFFTPREKHHLAATLLRGRDRTTPAAAPQETSLEVPAAVAAASLAFELRVFQTLARFGLREPAP